MTQTSIQKRFKPFKKYLPSFVSSGIRSFFTAILTPILFSYKTGHFKSSFLKSAVSKNGDPIPWYTYSCIDFLTFKDYSNKVILEFGGGQSSLWWAKQAQKVVVFEGDKDWYEKIKKKMPENVQLFWVPESSKMVCMESILSILKEIDCTKFDIIIVDGLFRADMIEISTKLLNDQGAIIADDSESFDYYNKFLNTDFRRVDFYGNAPGVVLAHCTSVFYKENCFLFKNQNKIANIALGA